MEPVATVHALSCHQAVTTHAGPVQPDGTRWVEARPTGTATYRCACGYDSGPVPKDSLSFQELSGAHPYGKPIAHRIVRGEIVAARDRDVPGR